MFSLKALAICSISPSLMLRDSAKDLTKMPSKVLFEDKETASGNDLAEPEPEDPSIDIDSANALPKDFVAIDDTAIASSRAKVKADDNDIVAYFVVPYRLLP